MILEEMNISIHGDPSRKAAGQLWLRSGVSYAISKNHRIMLNHVYSGIDRVDSDQLRSVLENTFRGTRDLRKNIVSLTYEVNALDEKLRANVFGKYYQQETINIDPEINKETNEIVDDITSANKVDEGYGFTLSMQYFRISPC